jgi:hypothetical protein
MAGSQVNGCIGVLPGASPLTVGAPEYSGL